MRRLVTSKGLLPSGARLTLFSSAPTDKGSLPPSPLLPAFSDSRPDNNFSLTESCTTTINAPPSSARITPLTTSKALALCHLPSHSLLQTAHPFPSSTGFFSASILWLPLSASAESFPTPFFTTSLHFLLATRHSGLFRDGKHSLHQIYYCRQKHLRQFLLPSILPIQSFLCQNHLRHFPCRHTFLPLLSQPLF